MTEQGTVSWLRQEVEDLLDVSSVGLYEFIWTLRGMYPAIAEDQAREIAKEVLVQLLGEGTGKLVLHYWPSEKVVAELDVLDAEDWWFGDPQTSGKYVALDRP